MDRKIVDILKQLKADSGDYDAALAAIGNDLSMARGTGNEQEANELWAAKTIVWIHREYVNVFNLLSARDYYEAWCRTEQIEIRCNNLLRNFPGLRHTVQHVLSHTIRLQALYPYQLFCSTVINIRKERCSICGSLRGLRNDCGHRSGYVYNGKFCYNTVEECELKGVDIVDNPVNKYAVLFPTGKNGHREDRYDYRLLEALMGFWKEPFQYWDYRIEHTHRPPEDFPGLSDNDYCPCGSGHKYGECCKPEPEGIRHRIYHFTAVYAASDINREARS